LEVLIRSNNLVDKIISYIKENDLIKEDENIKEILVYGLLDKELLKKLNDYFDEQNVITSYKFIIPKIQYYKCGLIYIHQNKMGAKCEVRTNPKCNAQFLLIDDLFIAISGIKNKGEDFINKIIFINHEDKDACDSLRKIFLEDWKTSYNIHL